MKSLKICFLGCCIAGWIVKASAMNIDFHVVVEGRLNPINPTLFGTNALLNGDENWAAYRQGGNRMTGYNWENNYSNAGNDYLHNSDDYLVTSSGISVSQESIPGIVTTTFVDKANSIGAYPLVTLQMAGYVAKDKNGQVTAAQTAPSTRWDSVVFEKGSDFSDEPDLSDGFVYMDEYVNFLVDSYGTALSGGVRGYSLDNEPDLWFSTHPRIHPNKTTCQEIVQKSVALARAVKKVDPDAEIFGFVSYGFSGYNDFQGAPDWGTVRKGKSYGWFIDYFLDEMKKAEESEGKRLLDVLDLHWYPEAQGDHRIVNDDATTDADNLARVQAPRTLWDPQYVEKSWIAQGYRSYLPILPKVKASIDKFYPGTKLAFTEISYGGGNHISGAIATADFLGVFAKYGIYWAALWPTGGSVQTYTSAGYKLYRNYDGNNSTFGDFYVPSSSSDSVNSSIYGSILNGTNEIHLIVINKNFNEDIDGQFTVTANTTILKGDVWLLDKGGAQIRKTTGIGAVTGNAFTYRIPASSVCHILLTTENTLDQVGARQPSQDPDSKCELAAFPNPMNPSRSACRIRYALPAGADSRLLIYDLSGRIVKTFAGISGSGFVDWDGSDGNHRRMSSGVYCAVIQRGNEPLQTKKILYVK